MSPTVKMDFVLHDKQIETLKYLKDQKTNEILYGGAAGGAKSFTGCYWLLINCILYPGTRWLMGRAKLKILKETTMLTLFEVAEMLPVTLALNNQNNQIAVLSKKGTSTIFLKDLFLYPSDPDFISLGSLEITGAFIDEASEVVKKAVEVVRSRIRFKLDEYGLIPKLLMTSNPAKGHLYNDFYKPDRDGTLKKFRRFIKSFVTDNPFISRHYVANLEGIEDVSLRARLLLGDWEHDDREGILIPYEKVLDFFHNDFLPLGNDRYITADVALQGSDKFVVMVWAGWVVIEMKVIEKSKPHEVEQTINEMEKRNRVPRSNITFDADGVGGFLESYLKDAAPFHNGAAPIYKKKKFKEDYQNLKAQCYFHFARRVLNNETAFRMNAGPWEEQIKEEMASIRNASVGTDKKLAVVRKEEWRLELGRSPDFTDCLMMRSYFGLRKPKRYIRRGN